MVFVRVLCVVADWVRLRLRELELILKRLTVAMLVWDSTERNTSVLQH